MVRVFPILSLLGLATSACATIERSPYDRFVLIAEETTPQGAQATRTTFELLPNNSEWYAVVRGYEIREGGAWKAVDIGEDCRRDFSAPDGAIGTVRLVPPADVNALAPVCAPEPLFGAMTDIVSFVGIAYNPSFRSAELRAVGETLDLQGFSSRWSRPPSLIEATIEAKRGQVSLKAIDRGAKVIVWNPGAMDLMLRRVAGAGRSITLRGVETIALEVRLDSATGRLLSGRSLQDKLDLQMQIPGLTAASEYRIERNLTLKRAD